MNLEDLRNLQEAYTSIYEKKYEMEEKEEEMEMMEREHKSARRYSGTRVKRSTSRGRIKSDSFGSAMAQVVLKFMKDLILM